MAQLMTSFEVADALGIDEQTLRDWRMRGVAPRSLRLGANTVRFIDDDVTEWVKDQALCEAPVLDVEMVDNQQQVLPVDWTE